MSGTPQSNSALATGMGGAHLARQIITSFALGLCSFVMLKVFLALEARQNQDKQPRKGVYSRLRIPARNFNYIERDLVEQALLFPEDVVCVNHDDLIGPVVQQVLEQTRLLVKMSLRAPASSKETVLSQSRGVLLYGPPGTGKTTVAKV
jgi:Cdc6-like AAA superfamily ATPase